MPPSGKCAADCTRVQSGSRLIAHVCITGRSPMGQERVRGSFVTAADVAERAGVSRSAVSRTFTPGASVSNEARARILNAAGHLGYRVNRLAQGLTNARSNIVGLVGADIHQPFHAEILAMLSATLLADGFQCMLLNASNAEHDMGALIARVLEYRVCAIVVMNGTPPSRIVREALSNGVPVILVNKPMPGLAARPHRLLDRARGRAGDARRRRDRRCVLRYRSHRTRLSRRRSSRSRSARTGRSVGDRLR